MPNPVTHFEIMGGQDNDLQNFYRQAVGWEINADNPMNYGIVGPQDGKGIGGGVGPGHEDQGWVTVYIEVADPAAVLQKVEQMGGQTIMQPADVPGGPTIAQFRDPAGNMVGLVKAGSM